MGSTAFDGGATPQVDGGGPASCCPGPPAPALPAEEPARGPRPDRAGGSRLCFFELRVRTDFFLTSKLFF